MAKFIHILAKKTTVKKASKAAEMEELIPSDHFILAPRSESCEVYFLDRPAMKTRIQCTIAKPAESACQHLNLCWRGLTILTV